MKRFAWALCIMGCITPAAKRSSGYAVVLKERCGPRTTMDILENPGSQEDGPVLGSALCLGGCAPLRKRFDPLSRCSPPVPRVAGLKSPCLLSLPVTPTGSPVRPHYRIASFTYRSP